MRAKRGVEQARMYYGQRSFKHTYTRARVQIKEKKAKTISEEEESLLASKRNDAELAIGKKNLGELHVTLKSSETAIGVEGSHKFE